MVTNPVNFPQFQITLPLLLMVTVGTSTIIWKYIYEQRWNMNKYPLYIVSEVPYVAGMVELQSEFNAFKRGSKLTGTYTYIFQ